MNGMQKWVVIGIVAIVIAAVIFKFLIHNERRNLYEQTKQFDEDVRRGRYTPVETSNGRIRYEKHW